MYLGMAGATFIFAFLWWREGYMPLWYAAFAPISAVIAIAAGHPARVLGGPMIVAGLSVMFFAERMVAAAALRSQRDPKMEPFVRFLSSSMGLLLYRAIGLVMTAVGVVMTFTPFMETAGIMSR